MIKHPKHIILLLITLITTPFYAQVDPATPSQASPIISGISESIKLSFSDEFNGTEVNTAKWNIDNSDKSRASRPGLGISQWYWRPANVEVKDGNLVLKVSKHNSYTMHCGSINSRDKYETTYGYFETRIKIAEAAKGTHTAFWLQGKGMGHVDGTANDGAEIDVFESAWLEDYTKSVLHIDGYGANHKANTKKYNTPGIHEGFHTFSLYWTKDFLKIYYDGVLKVTYSDAQWLVHANEYLWLSDGASFGFSGDHFTRAAIGYLTEAHVDYIRVWSFEEKEDDPNELVQNGDFEDPQNKDWASADNYSDLIYNESGYPVAEGHCCRMPGASQPRAIAQEIELRPGSSYQFSCSGRIQNSHGASGSTSNNKDGKGPATLKAEIIADNTILKTFTIDNPSNSTTSGEFTTPQGISKVTLKLSKEWNIAYIDNVSIQEISSTYLRREVENQCPIFPNPSKGFFQFTNPEAVYSYSIYNSNGQLIKTESNAANSLTIIDVSNFNAGNYYVTIKDYNKQKIQHKLIIL